VNVLCNQVADHGADQNVGWKMLLSPNTRKADPRRQTVNSDFGEKSWVFMRNYAGGRPGSGSVLRRKRGSARTADAIAIALKWPLPPECVLQPLHHKQTV